MNAGDPVEWYLDIPVVSRAYLTLSFLTTAACALDVVSPFSLYFNSALIWQKGQVWRLATNFMFFGAFGIDFVFHMYFMCRYSRLLEENSFRGRTADFVWMLMFGAAIMTLVAPYVSIHFLGSSLTFMMVYVWGRRNRYERMSFLGLFPFNAPYLPWVLLSFSYMLGGTATALIDIIGMVVGHVYFYFEDVLPSIAEARGWTVRHPFAAPDLLHRLCGNNRRRNGNAAVALTEPEALQAAAAQAAAQAAEAAEGMPANANANANANGEAEGDGEVEAIPGADGAGAGGLNAPGNAAQAPQTVTG